ncbi:MAG: phenylalanine--tRNA ligase subunit beta, partial [Ruminococcus sp.]|nr:phenylalanine--tRNA ligase subunit beta [Ruminococcus sp.]
AGVMGGEYSGIMDDTTTVVFESAYFEPTQVRRTSKALKLKSDASMRYEKGVDRLISMTCLNRAFELVEMLGAGDVVRTVIDKDYTDKTPACVEFNAQWINDFLGTDIPEADMVNYLEMLGFKIENGMAYAPSFRIDIECKADIAEEVARIYGYDKIPSTEFRGVAEAELTDEQKFIRALENNMVALGGYGIATFSFISPKHFDKLNLPADSKLRNPITIINPLGEDTSIMRTSILPSMLEILSSNYNNRNEAVKLYEIGKEYIPNSANKLPDEPDRLAVGMYGDNVDFYDIKGIAETLLAKMGISDVEYVRACECDAFDEAVSFHPGRSAVVLKDGAALGIFGEVHPQVQENYGIGTKTYIGKFNIPEMMKCAVTEISYKPLPKFPASTRDLSVICDDNVPVAELEKAIKGAVGKILEKVTLFDVYKGQQIEEGKKSVSYSITMRSHEGTLTDEQADGAMKKVLKALSAIGAELRI